MSLRTASPLLLALALAAAPSAAEEPWVVRFPVSSAGGHLVVALDFGSVEVVPRDAAEIRVEARATGIGASAVRFDAEVRDGRIRVSGDAEPWVTLLRAGPSVRVRAFVPPGVAVSLERGAERAVVPAAYAGVPLR